jgi:hypothetical protein
MYYEHRIAFLIMTGEWPTGEIDHQKPGTRADNRWNNLRPSNHSENLSNRPQQINNLLGLKGVSSNHKGGFYARIQARGKTRHLGTFTTPETAHAAHAQAARELHGEFARTA